MTRILGRFSCAIGSNEKRQNIKTKKTGHAFFITGG